MKRNSSDVFYWDASAILSVIFQDSHSHVATKWIEADAIHFISSLAYAEVCAVIARLAQQKILSDVLISASFDVLDRGPWRRVFVTPDWSTIKELSEQGSLRGADLWHLVAARKLQEKFPELVLLTFDNKLKKATKQEKLNF